jgi:predicted RNA-binding Zn ribbon-like protein
MADTGIFTNGTEVARKAGAGANSTATAEVYTNDFIIQAESLINNICRYNFSDNYSSLNSDTRELLKLAASNIAAMYVINYDMSGYTNNREAETMQDFLWAAAQRAMALLRDKKRQTFINGS